jgi:DNA-binding NarL/FixJ family response regulator
MPREAFTVKSAGLGQAVEDDPSGEMSSCRGGSARERRRGSSPCVAARPDALTILLVDDHQMFREGLRLLIGRELPEATVIGEAGDMTTALEASRALRPDVVIMDLYLPDGDGIEATRRIQAESSTARVIILSAETSLAFVREALKAGVSGYLLKDSAPDELPQAIRAAMDGRLHLCAEASRVALEDYRERLAEALTAHRPALSARERQVLRLIGEGLVTREIAEKLKVGLKSAETYRRRLIAKVGCTGTAQLVRYAIREGLARI